jgi:hypothetical protein
VTKIMNKGKVESCFEPRVTYWSRLTLDDKKSLEHRKRMADQENMPRGAVSRISRWATVLFTIGAWLVLSNHCVLGLGESAKSDSEAGGCPMHSAPAKGSPVKNVPCCKDLRAVASHAVKGLATGASQVVGVQDYGAAVFPSPRVAAQLRALGAGPPRSLSFAESILQRSILAHAPPAGFPRV